MLRRRPDALQLKPAYPGASISSAVFLDDGRLALTMALPSQAGNAGNGMLDEAWIFDPARGSLVPFTTPSNPQAARVVVTAFGRRNGRGGGRCKAGARLHAMSRGLVPAAPSSIADTPCK